MANNNDTNNILNEIKHVWSAEGLSANLADNNFKALLDDPAVRLLVGAVLHQSALLTDEINSFQSELTNSLIDFCGPSTLFQSSPAVGILQTAKRIKRGLTDEETSIIDDKTVFTITPNPQSKKDRFSFIPILETAVLPVEIRNVEQIAHNGWRISLEEKEPIESLAGLSFYFPQSISYGTFKLYSNGESINCANLHELDRLPFSKSFLYGVPFSKNTMQYVTLQTIHDKLCCCASDFFVVLNDKTASNICRQNGLIIVDIKLENSNSVIQLSDQNTLINCIPVINATPHTNSLSKQHPLESFILKDEDFLALLPSNEFPDIQNHISIRTTGSIRMGHQLWMKRMVSLLDQYNADHILLKETLGNKLELLTEVFLPMLREKIENDSNWGQEFCLSLNDKSIDSINVTWLSTQGAKANGLDHTALVNTSAPFIDDDNGRTKLVTTTIGGSDAVDDLEKKKALTKSYLIANDRIVTKSDLVIFCKQSLHNIFNLSDDDIIEMRSENKIIKNEHGLYERALILYIFIRPDCINIEQTENYLQRMIKSRTTSATPILINLVEYGQ